MDRVPGNRVRAVTGIMAIRISQPDPRKRKKAGKEGKRMARSLQREREKETIQSEVRPLHSLSKTSQLTKPNRFGLHHERQLPS
jgi:hypothetical protein